MPISYGDVGIGEKKVITFTILNHSDNVIRFFWLNNNDPFLELVPSIGFLLPKQAKIITATFTARETIKIAAKELFCEMKVIKPSGEITDWDSNMKTGVIKKITPTEYTQIQKRKQEEFQKRREEIDSLILLVTAAKKGADKPKQPAGKDAKKKEDEGKQNINEEASIEYEDFLPEPVFTVVDKSEKYNLVKITAFCDYVKFFCGVKEIKFKSTTMYNTRKQDFQLKNLSQIAMNYAFNIINPLTGQTDFGPYSIHPKTGSIPSNSDESLTIRFSPIETDENYFKRQVVCDIKDQDPNQPKLLTIDLMGDTDRPVCYFEIKGGIKQENDYKMLECESVGMGVKTFKKFFVLNPTNLGYDFEWEQQDIDENSNQAKVFRCTTQKGVIYSGKKFEIIFEYTPNSLGNHESYWFFKINSEKINYKFLLSGTCREPMILFNVGKVNFGQLLLQGKNKEVIQIINEEENIPFKFSFDKDSVKGPNSYGDSLQINPMFGTLAPKSSFPIELTFMPKVEKEFNWNLVLRIKQRQKPLVLNVKGIGYKINHGVYLDNKPELRLIPINENKIDFGEFFINEKRERSIILENTGNFNFHYAFRKNGADYLNINPLNGTVKKGEKINVLLTVIPALPSTKFSLSNHKIHMQIVSGPTYTFLLNARARIPNVHFSTVCVNFGPCYVMRQHTSVSQVLTIRNLDKEALSVETNFENKNKSHLDIANLYTGQVVLPYTKKTDKNEKNEKDESLNVQFIFTPREFIKYREIIKFTFNGIYDVEVEVLGEGIPLRLELEDPNLQVLNFGIIQLGQFKKMEFSIINRGRVKLPIQIMPENPTSFAKRCLVMKTNIKPDETCILEPRQTKLIEVEFNPNMRIPLFNEDIFVKVNNTDLRRLLTVSAASYGVDVKIIGELPHFGEIVVGSFTSRTVQIRNFGDLPAKFKWETPTEKKNYTKFFIIEPNSGTIPPHEDIHLKITFYPKEANNNVIFEKIKCMVENYEPLYISLYGKSIEIQKENQIVQNIETEVRVPKTVDIKIKNTSLDKVWKIQPTISSTTDDQKEFVSYFKGESIFEIKENSEGIYTLTYLPLTMNKPGQVYEAIVFFPTPDGSAKSFKFLGTCTEPKPKKQITETVKAREWKVIRIDIQNWLFSPQRFKVSWLADKKDDPTIFLKGANTIDVASNSSKEYKLSFRSWKDCVCTIKLTFENPETKEYVIYNIVVTTTPADSYPVTELAGPVREMITSQILITNPLKTAVTIKTDQIIRDNQDVIVKPDTLILIPDSVFIINFINSLTYLYRKCHWK